MFPILCPLNSLVCCGNRDRGHCIITMRPWEAYSPSHWSLFSGMSKFTFIVDVFSSTVEGQLL